MKFEVRVATRAKKEKVTELSKGILKVWVHPAPEKGRANAAVLELLAKHFGKPKNFLTILQGKTKGYKIIEIS
jgi:uncharacterized protein YggU (UPF0235/DUF167 family)